MKYNNKKVVIDGHTFDSTKEGNRYLELKLMERAGVISELELQPKFEIIPKFESEGVKYRATHYIADFKYKDNGQEIVEDVKSYITKRHPVYIMKKKLFKLKYPQFIFREFD